MKPHPSREVDIPVMRPDYVLFIGASTNFELLFVEVKRTGTWFNSTGDLVKLGKEMQVALDKLVIKRVNNPTVVGMVVEGKINNQIKVSTYLLYN